MPQGRFLKTEIVSASFIALLFLASAYLTKTYTSEIEGFINACGTNIGILAYIGVAIFATVVAPVSATPLIPIASALWGPVLSAIFSIIGWTIGSVIAFWISRRYGYAWVQRFVNARKLQQYVELIPKKNLFFTVILLRIVLPVDLLSYALGLFSKMPLASYTFATVIGIAPFAFIFTFTAQLPVLLQVGVLSLLGIMLYFSYKRIKDKVSSDTERL